MADPTPIGSDELASSLQQAETGPGGLAFLNGRAVSGASFGADADFSERFLDNVTFERCKFNATPLFRSNLSSARFVDCEFLGCNLAKTEVVTSSFERCRFEDSRFQRTMFSDCAFTDTEFANCYFYAKSWFGGTASRTTFHGIGEQPAHIEDLASADVTWAIEPGTPPPPTPSTAGTAAARPIETDGIDQIVSTLKLATVDSYDQQPISNDPAGTILEAFRRYDRLGQPTDQVVGALTPNQRLSLVARFAQLCGLAIHDKAPEYLSAAIMVYEVGAAEDDWRHNYMVLGVYRYTLTRLSDLGVDAPEPIQAARLFSNDLQKFDESLAGRPVSLAKFGLQETVIDGKINFGPNS